MHPPFWRRDPLPLTMPRVPRLSVLLFLGWLVVACSGAPAARPSGTSGAVTPTPIATPTPAPRLTVHDLFHPTAPAPASDPARVRTLIATGDVIPTRLVNLAATRQGDFLFPFRPTADYVRNADLTYINLESPLLDGCIPQATGMDFCGDPRFVGGLKLIGTRVANLANNHVYPGPSTERTAQLLRRNGIEVTTDLGSPVPLDVRGLPFVFVGCNAVSGRPVDRAALRANIEAARRLARGGVVVVQFHWGKEYERLPLPAPGVAPDDPVELGHLAVDSGADLVIGNHPHWVQAVEVYKNHLITYAHGNYVFDQANCWPSIGPDYLTYCSDDTRSSVIGTYTFYDNHLVAVTWKPTYTDAQLTAQFADPARAASILQGIETGSQQLAARLG